MEPPPLPKLSSRSLIRYLLPALLAGACTKGAPAPEQANVGAPSPDEAPPAADPAPAGAGVNRSHKGEAMPTAALKSLDGKTASLAQFRGRPVLVNLWATWCAPCVKEMPTLDKLAGDGTVRVASVAEDEAGKVAPFMARAKLAHLEPLLDPQMTLSTAAYQANLPTSVLYGSDGREVWRYLGDLDWTGPKAKALLAEAK